MAKSKRRVKYIRCQWVGDVPHIQGLSESTGGVRYVSGEIVLDGTFKGRADFNAAKEAAIKQLMDQHLNVD